MMSAFSSALAAAQDFPPAPAPENLSQAVARLIGEYFAAHGGALPPAGLYERVLREIERPLIEQTLTLTGGNQLRAAALLGLNRNTLRKKIRALGIGGSL